eukprot:6398167-Alexandrium_andersonii.AAC.1
MQLFIDLDCSLHGLHLIYKDGLKHVDGWLQEHRDAAPFKYFSGLAKVSHVARDKARVLFERWHDRFGAADALAHVRQLCPRCLSGRWGSVTAVEEWIGGAGGGLEDALSSVLAKQARGVLPLPDDPGRVVDELSLEEQRQYSERMG